MMVLREVRIGRAFTEVKRIVIHIIIIHYFNIVFKYYLPSKKNVILGLDKDIF
jgi:hypothetical protein